MKRLFKKDEIWFAVVWIVIYVMGFSAADSLSEQIGIPKLITAALGLVLTAILLGFINREQLKGYYGLCVFNGDMRRFLYFVPLIVISSVNLWNGICMNVSAAEAVLWVVSMCCVGFIEEIIFRGFLFKGMSMTNIRSAVIVSSLTFGVGHIVNLLMGADMMETLLQLVYASAIGFCYTAVFLKGGSLIPCILSHAAVNSTSIFAIQPGDGKLLAIAAVQTLLAVSYGLWLLKDKADITADAVSETL